MVDFADNVLGGLKLVRNLPERSVLLVAESDNLVPHIATDGCYAIGSRLALLLSFPLSSLS